MRVLRVFPRRTRATPDDEDVRIGVDPGLFDKADKVEVSVAFTWDLPLAERLEKAWGSVAPTSIGGPAMGERGGDFAPGKYLKRGYVITSRDCSNRCWFCSVWKREGDVRELPITEGHNVLDDNLLACSKDHVRAVFAMLSRQKQRPEFTGGLEAKLMDYEIAESLYRLRPKSIFFAYDTPDDREPLAEARKMLTDVGFSKTNHGIRCYVLIGYPKDTMPLAEERLRFSLSIGFTPMAMLYRDKDGRTEKEWRQFQRAWARPAIIHAKNKAEVQNERT